MRERQLPTRDRDDVPEDLGPIILPSAADAHRVLGELAALYHERFEAAQRYEVLKAQAKTAADTVARLSDRIAERIRVATHRTGLPLFGAIDGADDV